MVVLLAKQAPVGIILRRGPTRWWQVTHWSTRRDVFQSGQWFHGRIYPEKCDISPDGKLWAYFAAKFGRPYSSPHSDSWTAVARPPYLTALALWPIGGAYGGNGVFIGDRTIMIGCSGPERHHPDHPPGPLQVLPWDQNNPRLIRSYDAGWEGGRDTVKRSADLVLEREFPMGHYFPSRTPTPYLLSNKTGEPIAQFDAHWADWDQQGRLVATAGGRVVAGKLTRDRKRLVWRQLADLHEEKPTRLEAPDWAQQWGPVPRRLRRVLHFPYKRKRGSAK